MKKGRRSRGMMMRLRGTIQMTLMTTGRGLMGLDSDLLQLRRMPGRRRGDSRCRSTGIGKRRKLGRRGVRIGGGRVAVILLQQRAERRRSRDAYGFWKRRNQVSFLYFEDTQNL